MTPRELEKLYSEGKNITALLRNELNIKHNTPEIIEVAYDMQTGSYIEGMKDPSLASQQEEYSLTIAKVIASLGESKSILEVGVGEATTLSGVLQNIEYDVKSYGFDLSWSRIAFAKNWLHSQGLINTTLCTGDLFNIPFRDNSIDIVYSSHSIEPNGGNEAQILKELHRIARKHVVLLEPAYELSNEEAKKRMDYHGYCKGLKETAISLNYDVVQHELLPVAYNPLNPTALTIISKQSNAELPKDVLACPKFKTPLKEVNGVMYSPEGLVAYPIIGGIPCLRIENGVFSSKLEEIMGDNF